MLQIAAATLRHRSDPSSRREGASGYQLIQLQHAMADVAILCQMGGRGISTTAAHHLVERVTFGKTWIRFLAELTEPSGLNFESSTYN